MSSGGEPFSRDGGKEVCFVNPNPEARFVALIRGNTCIETKDVLEVFPKFRYRVPGESIRNVAARGRGAWFVTKWPASIKQLIPGQSVVLYLSNLRHLYITPALMQVLQVVLTLKTQPRSQIALRILLL
jgi:hypothetical protein